MNIAIIEKNKAFRESLKAVLNQFNDFNVIYDCDSCKYFNEITDTNILEVILLDCKIASQKKERIISNIKIQYAKIKIIVLADYPESITHKTFLEEGADDIILKNANKSSYRNSICNVFMKNTLRN